MGTQDTIDLSLAAQEIGVDVLSIITPYFAALNQEELYRHYADIAAAVKLPIVMYNIPMRIGLCHWSRRRYPGWRRTFPISGA